MINNSSTGRGCGNCRRSVRMIAVSMLSLLLLQPHQPAQACSPPFGELIGPFFAPIPGVIGNNPYLWTTTDSSEILLGTITLFDGADQTGLNVTIALTDGSVTSGWPVGAVPTTPPALLLDPTGGYQFAVNGSTVTFTKDDETFTMLLEVPALYTVLDPTNQAYFLVDEEDATAFVFYSGILQCETPEAQMADERCTTCTTCQFQNNFAATLDLASGETIRTGYMFESPYSVALSAPGPMNSVTTVWNSFRIVNVGALDSCGGTGYLRYDPGDGIVEPMMRFDPGFLYALDPTTSMNDDDSQYTAYSIDETTEQVMEQRFVSNFAIRKFSMLSGETISTTPMDTAALWALSGREMPTTNSTTTNGTSPTPAPNSAIVVVPFSIRAPTPAPASSSSNLTGPPAPSLTLSPVLSNDNSPVVGAANIPTNIPMSSTTNASDLSAPPVIANPLLNNTDDNTTVVAVTSMPIPLQPNNSTTSLATPSSAPINANNTTTNTTTVLLPESCSANEACNALALTGDCCPTIQSVMLQCCQMGTIELNCPANPRCADSDLEGACCPTPEGIYLDCCEVVPDDCGVVGTSCEVLSVAEYKALRSASATTLISSFVWLLQILVVGWKITA